MAHGVHAAADREVFPRRRVGAGIGRHHTADVWLVQPSQRAASPNALIKDHLGQARVARQMQPRLGHQGPGPQGLMSLHLGHVDRQRHLGHGIAHEEHLPAVDGDLDLVHVPPRIFKGHLVGNLTTPRIAVRRVQIGVIGPARDVRPPDADPRQCPQVPLHEVLGQGLRANRPGDARAVPPGSPALKHTVADLRRIEADPLPEGVITAQENRQGMDAFHPTQRFQPVEQDVVDEGDHRAADARAAGVLEQRHPPERRQAMNEVIQHRPFIQPVDALDHRRAIQAPRHRESSLLATSQHHRSARCCVVSSRVCPMIYLPLRRAFPSSWKVDHRSRPWLMLESQNRQWSTCLTS